MPTSLPMLGRRPISYDSASREEFNVIRRLAYVPAIQRFYRVLWDQRESIEAIIKHHLQLGTHDTCTVLAPDRWLQGGFNVCLLVEVVCEGACKIFVFRCPMPHKVIAADEKISCEVGAYIWIQEMCHAIHIPHLVGFGFSDGHHFTHASHRPLYKRVIQHFWRFIYRISGQPTLSQYSSNPTAYTITSPYALLEYIGPETGEMLSNTWDEYRTDPSRRKRLFRGMAQIILDLARVPQAHIGTFKFNYTGTITLTNRYLSCSVAILENDGAERTINGTYSCTDAFVSDMISFHDHRFLSEPNAILDESDCRGQMAVRALLRVLSHRYIKAEHRYGPFLLQLTDFNPSNILVDKDWNIRCLLDLEWICAQPIEMLDVPYWLTGCSVDEITGEQYEEFNKVRKIFMQIMEEQEQVIRAEHGVPIREIMHEMWNSKGIWFWHCLSSINAMDFLLGSHLSSRGYLSTDTEEKISEFWCEKTQEVVQKKLADKQAYDKELRQLFNADSVVSYTTAVAK